MGFIFDFNIYKLIIGVVLTIILIFISIWMFSVSTFSYSIFVFLLIFFWIPNIIFYLFSNGLNGPIIALSLFMLIFSITSMLKFKMPKNPFKENQVELIVIIITTVFFIPIAFKYFKIINLNVLFLNEIYETRENFKLLSDKPYINYFLSWEIKILAPTLFLLGLAKKKYRYTIIAFLILLFIYLVSGHRTVYSAVIILSIFYFIGKTFLQKLNLFIILIFILAFIIIPFLDIFSPVKILHAVFYERIFFDQALTTNCYFDFFENKPLYFSESFLFKFFTNYPFDKPSAYLIGEYFFNNPSQHVNTGFIGDAYMNWNFIGVILVSFIVSFIFAFFNSLKIDPKFFGIFVIFLFDLQNAGLLSTLFSGGLGIFLILAFLLMSKKET